MKLKKYNEFIVRELFETVGNSKLTDEMSKDIKDILLELHDDQFFISQHITDFKKVGNRLCEDVIEIIIDHHTKKSFSFNKIEDYVRRLIDYMSPYKWNYSLFYFGVHNFIEFESGGEQLISNKKSSIESEKILQKSLELDDRSYKVKGISMVPKYCESFKIVFYQNIDHLYNEKYKSIELFNLSDDKDDKFNSIEKIFSELPKDDILDCLMDLTDIGVSFYKEMLNPCLWKGEGLIQLNTQNSDNELFKSLATSDFWSVGDNIFSRKNIKISNLEMIESILRSKSQQEIQSLLNSEIIFNNFKQMITSEVDDFNELISQDWIPCLLISKLKLKNNWIYDKKIINTLQEIRDKVFNLYNYEMIFFPEVKEPSLLFVDNKFISEILLKKRW